MKLNRRSFLKTGLVASSAVTLTGTFAGCATNGKSANSNTTRVVIIGGGFGGATCAKYLDRFSKGTMEVTLVEPKTEYTTCPGSNWYLAGLMDFNEITQNYDALKSKHNVNVVHDYVTEVNADDKKVILKSGKTLPYDRLVMSPGIDFKYDTIEGYSAEGAKKVPHAWQAGPQTKLLHDQLREMKDGGLFVIAPPPNPFRCPPGPYERISMVAEYFKKNKPKSKILVLDSKNKFSKMGLFKEGWEQLYGDMIEWVGKMDGGQVTKVDVDTKTVWSEYGEVKADVLNLIPAQKAGAIAFKAGLTNDSGWCPINQHTFESTIHSGIHVIGDASISGKMPKSGHSASSQGKMCAAAIVSLENGWSIPSTKNVNTCYSLVGDNYGISVAAVYEMHAGKIAKIKGSGGVSPMAQNDAFRKQEASYARGWYKSITTDIWKS